MTATATALSNGLVSIANDFTSLECMLKGLLKYFLLSGVVIFLFACGGELKGVAAHDNCPENVVCDTVYTDLQAYSFVIFSGKNKLDTVTAMTDEMTCDIEDFYFRCTWKKVYRDFVAVYSADGLSKKRRYVSEDSVVHEKVEIKRVDTIFVNYGKFRKVDYIPPYVETPKLDKKKLRDVFDTVTVGPYEYREGEFYGATDNFLSYYEFDGYGLPDWAGISSYENSISYDENGVAHVSVKYVMSNVVVKNYPLTLKRYNSHIYTFLDGPLERDTTVTWTAYYTDLYGVRDSTEITTVFTMKKE